MQISDLAAFSTQPTRPDNFSSQQTGWTVYDEKFAARLAEISAAQAGISASVQARLFI